jgi:hypothetical protein
VTHQRPLGPGIDKDIKDAEKRKYNRYLPNYEMNKNEIVPLVFTFNGGWSEETSNILTLIFKKMVENEKDTDKKEALFNKHYTRFKYQNSIIIVKSLGQMLNKQIWTNSLHLSASVGVGVETNEMSAELELDDHESSDSEDESSETDESQSNPEEDEDTTATKNKRHKARKLVSKKPLMPKIKPKHKISSSTRKLGGIRRDDYE